METKDTEQFLKELEAELESQPKLDPTNPKDYAKICRSYSEVIAPGLKAIDRELARSRTSMRVWC